MTYDPYANQYLPDDEFDLRVVWRTIVKYRWTIFFITAVFMAITIAATLSMRPVYRADVLLEVKPPSGTVVKFQNLEQVDHQPQEYKNTQQSILRSKSVADAVISELSLDKDPELSGELTQRGFISGLRQLAKPLKAMISGGDDAVLPDYEKLEKQEELLNRFSDRLSVSEVRNSNLFRVSFESFTPEVAADVANTVVEQFVSLSEERRFGSTSGAKQFLEVEIDKVQARLETSEKDLTDYAREHEIVDVEDNNDIMTTQLNELNSRLTQISGDRIAAESLYVQSQSPNGFNVLPQVLESALIQTLKSQYASLQGEYYKLSKIYKPAYPRLVQLEEEMNRVKTSLDQEVDQIAKSLKSDYEQLKKEEELLQQKLDRQKENLLALKDRSIQYNILKREWETNKQLYTGLLERMKEVGVAGGMEINNIAIIDRARVPVDQYKPVIVKNVSVATALGLFFGLGIAFLLAFLDNTVRTPEELETIAGVANLGLIPKNTPDKNTDGLNENGLRQRLALISNTQRDHGISEAFRSIRTSLMFSSPNGLPKVVQVTSTTPGEGKSTISSNIAAVMADNGLRVALIDADLRKPSLNKLFSVPSAPGLSEILTEQTTKPPVFKTAVEGLTLIPSGTPPPNPAELLGSSAFDRLLESLGDQYDLIVIDSAPLLGLADSVIISTKVDGVIYAVHAGEVNKDGLREGVKRLRRVQAPIVGAILNQADLSEGEYGYYGSEYFDYGSTYNQSQLNKKVG